MRWSETLALTVIFAGFMALDVYTTHVILASGGRELNPLAHPFLEYGSMGLVVQKLLGLGAVMALTCIGRRYAIQRGVPRARHAYWALVPFAAFPAIWNLGVIA